MGRKVLSGIFLAFTLVAITVYLLPKEDKFFLEPSTQLVIKSLPYYVDKSGWELMLDGKTDGQNSLSFQKKDRDTTKHIIFAVDSHKKAVGIIRYTKKFSGDGKQFTVEMNSRDTLFSFYNSNSKDTIFQTGEYYYKFSNFQLDSSGRKYYLLHKDSLVFVRGDNLPKLPSLSPNERKLLNEKLK